MSATPSLLTRSVHQVDLMIKTDPNVLRYRFRGHRSLDGAFFGAVEMFTAQCGSHYRSPTLLQNKTGVVEDSKRGMTRITFDPGDFVSTSPSLPTDQEVLFLRVEDYSIALGGYLPPGQILVVPPPAFFGVQDSTISLAGTAPGGVSAVAGAKPPPGAMTFGLPLYSTSANILNLDSTNNLLVSFNEGMPMVAIAPKESILISDGSVVEVYVASSVSNPVEFSMFFTLTKV